MIVQLGPFQLLHRIGRGGMGETYVAERVGPKGFVQRVCVKRLIDQDATDPRWSGLFQKEAILCALLHHPNIVSVYDFGQAGDVWWMALELVEGVDLRTLADFMKESGEHFPVEVVLYIAGEVAKALAHAHSRRLFDGSPAGIVHRDVSPANILVSYDGGVKLADFGIAKAAVGPRTITGDIKGCAPYMSPEHILDLGVDGRTDLFALGVVMFELFAGIRPFDAPTLRKTTENVVEGKGHDLRLLAPWVPDPVANVVRWLLRSKKEDRVQCAEDLLDAIGASVVPTNVVLRLGALVKRAKPETMVPRDGLLTSIDVEQLTRGRGRDVV